MLTQQEISDRLEISDLLFRYSDSVDRRDWDRWETVFTDDAVIDYTEMGGPRGNVKDTRAFLEGAMPRFKSHQHMIGNTMIEIDGDRATARSICYNPMVLDQGDGKELVFVCGLWYRDELVRTPEGWKIKDRYEERCYIHNMPPEILEQAEAAQS